MTDKELFEKVEKKFLPEKAVKLERFNKTKFQKVLNEIKGPQAPQANVGGFLSRAAAAIPGTRGYRMRSAEARKQEALAKQEELKAQKAEKDLTNGNKVPEMDKATEQVYKSNPQFAAAYNLAKAGKELTAQQQRVFNAGLKQIKELRGGASERAQAGEVRINILGRKAPTIANHINKNENLKNFYVKYTLQSDSLGIPDNAEIATFAKAIQDFYVSTLSKGGPNKRNEISELKKVIAAEPNLIARADGGKFLLKLIKDPETPKKTIGVAKKNRIGEVKKMASDQKKSFEEMLKDLNNQSAKFKIDTEVKVSKGGKKYPRIYNVVGHDESTGAVKIRGVEGDPRLKYYLPMDLVRVQDQGDLPPVPESFEQVVKKYR